MEIKNYTCPVCGNKEHRKASLLGKADPNHPLDAFVCIKCGYVAFFVKMQHRDPATRKAELEANLAAVRQTKKEKKARAEAIKQQLSVEDMGDHDRERIGEELIQLEQDLNEIFKKENYYIAMLMNLE